MASDNEKGLPSGYTLGVETDNDTINLAATKNIKWVARVGSKTFGSPVVSQGKVFLGTQGTPSTNASIVCLDEQTGNELGRFICRRPQGRGETWGVCSTPTIEGDRLYFVSPYVEAVCVDLNSWLKAPASTSVADFEKHVVWRYDMEEKLHSVVDHAASCSPLVHGDVVYVCTGNGRFKNKKQPFYPLTPSLVVFNKRTGQLVARDDEQLGEQTWRGQWASPSLALVNGKPQILFAGGNSICYAFEPVDPAVQVAPDRWITNVLRGPIVSFIDVENKDTGGLTPVEYAAKFSPLAPGQKPALPLEFRFANRIPQVTPVDSIPTAQVPDVPLLKKIWWCDCMSQAYRNAPFYSHQYKGDGKPHPCDIISTPVFYRNRVYVAIGGDPNHGLQNSRGDLVCLDPTKTGDITRSGIIWSYDKLNATLTTMAITDGLVFVIGENSVVHCLDADTGQCYWTYELKSDRGLLSSALVVADGKVFVGKSILAASKTLKVLCALDTKTTTSSSTPCVANGALYIVHGKWLWAVCDKGELKP
ncbi:MAG: PQQ-binding-like beta-propeller repeat protein [Kiritimatiellaeota bacterium]|nr:PQQ-binding-like beta-propeller repeat protein [Kiritimatiellota bacterium]